jgi:hypothetical protein
MRGIGTEESVRPSNTHPVSLDDHCAACEVIEIELADEPDDHIGRGSGILLQESEHVDVASNEENGPNATRAARTQMPVGLAGEFNRLYDSETYAATSGVVAPDWGPIASSI